MPTTAALGAAVAFAIAGFQMVTTHAVTGDAVGIMAFGFAALSLSVALREA